MTRKIRTLIAGLVSGGLLCTAVVSATPVAAYPPGVAMTVSAKVISSPRPTVLTVRVARAKPGCTIIVNATSDNSSASGRSMSNTNGSITFTLTLARARGQVRVVAKSVGCAYFETATSTVAIVRPHVEVPARVRVETPFTITAGGFPPSSTVHFLARKGSQMVRAQGETNASGNVHASLTLPTKGTWVVVALGSGKMASDTVVAD